jgi:membrane protease YdiL (CAAX protease family)
MTGSVKHKVLIFLGLVTIVTVIIAASLPQLEFQPGMPLPKLEYDQVVVPPVKAEPSEAISVDKFIIALALLIAAASVSHMIYRLLRGAKRKDLIAFIWPVVVTGLILGGFVFLIMLLPKSESPAAVELPVPTPEPPVTAPLGPVPPLLLWLVGAGLLVTGILIAIWIFGSPAKRATTIDIVSLEAEKAWQELKAGLGLKDVIIKCYRQMSRALAEEQGIERKESMTAREFENLLEAAGVPYDPVHQLTQLFEAVRYGHWQPNPIDEEKAIHCLEAIVLYTREAKETA